MGIAVLAVLSLLLFLGLISMVYVGVLGFFAALMNSLLSTGNSSAGLLLWVFMFLLMVNGALIYGIVALAL